MDAIDILGSMLGHKSGGSGLGAEILKEILGGKPAAKRAPQPPRSAPPSAAGPADIHRDARDLEDLLNVAHRRHTGRSTGQPQQTPSYQAPTPPRAKVGSASPFPERPEPRSSLGQQVYTMSLTAIALDANAEAKYLQELAHGLRIPPHVCDQIHQRFGAPCISSSAEGFFDGLPDQRRQLGPDSVSRRQCGVDPG